MIRKLGLSTILLTLCGACSFHASVNAGSRTASQREQGQAAAPTSGSPEVAQNSDQPAARQEELAARDPAPATPAAPVTQPAAPEAQAPAHDHDRGHGNDADRVDEDNPGKSHGKKVAKADKEQSDHDRGHGNDADGVDEDNPGKSKGKKGK